MTGDLRLASRLLLRDWRAGEIRVLFAALALAVASLTAVGFFTDRVQQALSREANALLAGDLALTSDHAIAPELAVEAGRRGLATADTAVFLSMVRAGEVTALAGIKAASPGYPLRGQLRIADALYAPDRMAEGLPGPGEVWVDERLATELKLAVGDAVEVGELRLRVGAILTYEAERSGNFMALTSRLLMSTADLAGTGLVQEGSRIQYRLLIAGPTRAVADYRVWAEPRLARGQRIEGVADARPELREMLDRAQRFLGLSALLAVVLAAAAVQLSLRRYVQRHYDQFALLRCFGGQQRRLLTLYLMQLAGLGLAAGLVGGLGGLGAQQVLAVLLGSALGLNLPPPSLAPLGMGVLAGLAVMLAFSLPPMLRLARVPTLRVLRRDLGPVATRPMLAHLAGLAVIAGLIFWQAGSVALGLYVIAGLVAAMLVAAALVQGLLALIGRLAPRLPARWRMGLFGLHRRGGETTLQAMALSLGLFALLLLTLVRNGLVDSWQGQVPVDAPNRFVINIQPEQVAPLGDWLSAQGVAGAGLYPMVRGRLVAINDRPVHGDDYADERARRLAEREFNLSALTDLPPDNVLTAGRWWQPGEREGFSVEAKLAERLGIVLGDTLAFEVGGLPLSGQVTSLRTVEWDSFRVNFFVVAPPPAMAGLPASYITSFHLPRERGAVLAELVAAFPNVTVIDVEQIMAEVRRLMDRVSLAVQFIFLFTLAVGVLVMIAALFARRDERAREIGLWRTLGASRRTVRLTLAGEFAALGLLAGAVAAAAASGLSWVLAEQVFQLPPQLDPWVWAAGLGGGLVLVVGAGLAAVRGLIDAPPLAALRAGQ